MAADPVATLMIVVVIGALVALVVISGGMARYAMELRRAAERAHGEAERVAFWREVQVALNTRSRWTAALLQRIHRLVGGLLDDHYRQR